MAAKRFLFADPSQLKAINAYCKDGGTLNVARVWSAMCRQKGKTTWDGRILASFYTEGKTRKACVLRFSTGGEMVVIAWLKYAPALEWCFNHLRKIDPE